MNLEYDVWDVTPKYSQFIGADCYAAARYGATLIAVRPSNESGISANIEAYLDGSNGRYGVAVLVYLGPDTPRNLLDTPYHLKRMVTVILNVLQRTPNFKVGVHAMTATTALPDGFRKVAQDIVTRIKEMRHGQPNGERVVSYRASSSWA